MRRMTLLVLILGLGLGVVLKLSGGVTPPRKGGLFLLSLISPDTDVEFSFKAPAASSCGMITSAFSASVTSPCPPSGFWDSAQVDLMCSQIESCSVKNSSPLINDEDTKVEQVPAWFDSEEIIQLGPLLGMSGTSKVFSIASRPEFAIKYQTFPSKKGYQNHHHPVTLDYWFLRRIEKLGIAPKAIALSDKAEVPSTSLSNLQAKTRMNATSASTSTPTIYSVRYLIMDRTGPSIHRMLQGQKSRAYSLKRAFALGLNLIELLEKLHSEEIVHGDIHHGNICFASSFSSEQNALQLIDFGAARFVKISPNGVFEIARNRIAIHSMFSPFEMMGFRVSFRDDLFRAIQVTAGLVNGKAYFEYLEHLANQDRKEPAPVVDRLKTFTLKNSSSLFEILQAGFNPFETLDTFVSSRVRENLDEVTRMTRNLAQNQFPDYYRIKSLFSEIIAILE